MLNVISLKHYFKLNDHFFENETVIKKELLNIYQDLIGLLLTKRNDPIRLLGAGVRFKKINKQQLSFDFL